MRRIALLVAFMLTSLMATNIVVTTGKKEGSYYAIGKKIAKQFPNSSVMSSKGSIENVERIVKGYANVALVQKDALRYYLTNHPADADKIEYIGDLYNECVFLVAKSGGKVADDSDLQDAGIKVAVGAKGSGTAVTWKYMSQLEPNFKKATPVPYGGKRALAKVASGSVDAALFTTKPDYRKWLFKRVNANESLHFAPIKDWDLNDKFQGKPIYSFEEVKVRDSFFGGTVDTICTTATVIASTELSEEQLDQLSDIVLNFKNYITE